MSLAWTPQRPRISHNPVRCSFIAFTLEISWARAALQWERGCQRLEIGAARGRSVSLLSGLDIILNPPDRPETGIFFFFCFFLTTARMWLFYVSPLFYFLFFTPVLRWSRRRFDFFFSYYYYYHFAHHLSSSVRNTPGSGLGGDSQSFFFRGNNMSRRKQTNPFKVDCRYSRYCLNTISRVTHPCHVQYRCVNNGDVLNYCYYCCCCELH